MRCAYRFVAAVAYRFVDAVAYRFVAAVALVKRLRCAYIFVHGA